MTKNSKVTGFTLIELLVVVAVISILAAIAFPSYQEQVLRSRRFEGKSTLLDTAQALAKCKESHGTYNATDGAGANLCAMVDAITGGNTRNSAEGYYSISASAGPVATTFTLQAVPQITDPECGTLTIDETGAKGESGTEDVDYCW